MLDHCFLAFHWLVFSFCMNDELVCDNFSDFMPTLIINI